MSLNRTTNVGRAGPNLHHYSLLGCFSFQHINFITEPLIFLIYSPMASSSSSSSSYRYQVFLSFRGEDTRLNFTGHLYEALRAAGFNTFIDDDELLGGEAIRDGLLQAIQGSRVSIIVFSRRYGDSSWCLDELVEIIKCRRTVRQIVIPIFYDVDPSDVRKQRGSFGEAFREHEKRFASDLDRVLRWREALTEAAELSGWDLRNTLNGHEAKFIKEIVKSVSKELNCTNLFVALYPIGIESRVRAMNFMLDVEPNDKVCVGIWGMGGVGKTTIAKAVYNQTYDSTFNGRSFLVNVREKWSQPNGPVLLQEQLLSDILKLEVHVGSVDQGIKLIEEKFSRHKVLILVDDVDHINQLNALARHNVWFGPGSRIFVTTRDEHVLTQHEVDLLSWYAFRRSYPCEEYSELSRRVVDYCGGLPLALKVLGSFLYRRSAAEWESTLVKLKRSPHKDIKKVLRISFDGLEDDEVQSIFLDISCFFIGMNKDYVELILDGCELDAKTGINILLERSLLTIRENDENDKLMMHDLLRDMGRDLVQEKFPKEPENWSRLWSPKVVSDVLRKQTGTKYVEGLILNVEEAKKVSFSTKAFLEMRRLRLLQLNHVQLNGSLEYLSEDLRWLCWHGFPLAFIPNNFYVGNLVALDLQCSNLAHVWEEPKLLEKLKILDLSHSRNLRQTPDFSYIPNLEQLIMMDCESLEEVHDSIGLLKKLVLVNLEGCRSIKKLPSSFGKLKSLKTLSFSGCPAFENAGDFAAMIFKSFKGLSISDSRPSRIMTSLPSLEGLLISKTNVRNLPNLDGLSNLKYFEVSACDMLQSVPDLPTNVEVIAVTECRQLKRVPDMSKMTKLLVLSLRDCFKLVDVPGLNKLLTKSLAFLVLLRNNSMPLTLNERIIWEIINKRCYKMKDTIIFGDDIPEGFTFINKGCSVCVDVPQRVNCKLEGFACCILYSRVRRDLIPPVLFVINHTKGIRVKISSLVDLYPLGNNELWLRLVKNGPRYSVEEPNDLKLESGDKFSVVFSDESSNAAVKKIGVLLLWENENASVYDGDFARAENVREDAITLPIEGDTGIGSKRSPTVYVYFFKTLYMFLYLSILLLDFFIFLFSYF
ncbi:hypothetical protein UlMin_044176 [Ulmus minor]